jgi:hypothetical protein
MEVDMQLIGFRSHKSLKTMKVLKDILKFLLLLIVVTIVFIATSALLPYSTSFRTANQNADPSVLIFVLLNNALLCLMMIYLVTSANLLSRKHGLVLTGVLFLLISAMPQLETFFFLDAFPALTKGDVFLITLANGIPILVGVPLCMVLFKGKPISSDEIRNDVDVPYEHNLWGKIALIACAYVIVYFVFGYYVAWQEKDLRIFYSGESEAGGFFNSLLANARERPMIYPFQLFRGALFALLVIPIVRIFRSRRYVLLVAILLVFLSVGAGLIIPNVLMPDSVRRAHLGEMMSSMAVFAFIVWWVYARWKKN